MTPSTHLPPDCIRWITRNGEDHDCAVAAISLATGVSYEVVLGTAMGVAPKALSEGLTLRQIRATVAGLGHTTRLRRKYDLDDDTGILWVSNTKDTHVVYLWEGRIIEPSHAHRSLWLDPRAYLLHMRFTAGNLIVVEGR